MSGEKDHYEREPIGIFGFIRDIESAFVGGGLGAAIGAGIGKLYNLNLQLENSENPGAAMEIPIAYPAAGFALVGIALAIKEAVKARR